MKLENLKINLYNKLAKLKQNNKCTYKLSKKSKLKIKKALMKRNLNNFLFKLFHTTLNEVVYVNISEYKIKYKSCAVKQTFQQ